MNVLKTPVRLALGALVLFSYFYFATAGSLRWSSLALQPDATEPYQLLAKGFSMGRLGLSVDPDPRLATMANPWDPEQNGCCRFFDISYYKGAFYMQHGPLPLTFYLPVWWAFHAYPTGPLAILFFGAMNFVFLYLLLLRIKDRHFPAAPEWMIWLGGLGIGFGNIVHFHLGHAIFHFICIAAGEGFAALGFYSLHRALVPGTSDKAPRWMALAAACLSSTVAARFNLATGVMALAAAVTWWVLRWQGNADRPQTEKRALLKALWVPTVGIGLLVAGFNYARFDNIFEFGITYQQGSVDVSTSGLFSPSRFVGNIFYNLKVDLLQRFVANEHFPWVRASYTPLFPYHGGGRYFAEDTIGLFSLWPAAWLLLLLPAAAWAWGRQRQRLSGSAEAAAPFFGILWVVGMATMLPILAIASSTFRYFGDFTPLFMLLVPVTVMVLFDLPIHRRWKEALVQFYGLAMVYGLVAATTYSFCGFQCLFINSVPQVARFMDHLVGH